MVLRDGSLFELLLHPGEQEECLLHGIGDPHDVDELMVLQRRIRAGRGTLEDLDALSEKL